MSFDKLAEMTKAHPEAVTREKARAAEQRRKVWHDAYLSLVYPFWQGPLVKMARKAGVESATGGVEHGLPGWVEVPAVPQADWLIAELITVTASVGVGVQLAYVFAGDENDGTLARVVGLRDGSLAMFLPEHTKVWSGPLKTLVDAAEGDVEDASPLFGTLVLDAYDAKAKRLEREEWERKEAEKKAAEERAAAEMEAEANRRKMQEAALDESRRLEAEAAAQKNG